MRYSVSVRKHCDWILLLYSFISSVLVIVVAAINGSLILAYMMIVLALFYYLIGTLEIQTDEK